MKSSTQCNRKLRVVRLAITVGLAMLFVAVLLCGLRKVAPAHATPGILHVDGASGSDTTGCTDPANPCATIGYALGQAGEGDTILVAQGTYTENLVITKTVTLEGAYKSAGWSRCLGRYATTIDGNQSGAVITVTLESTHTTTAVIDGFTITNGNRGIHILVSSVSIRNSKIIHNHTAGDGGGVRIDRSHVTITNTLIADNESGHVGGAMIMGKWDTYPGTTVRIYNSTIAYNTAAGYYNGIFNSNSSLQIFNSIVWGHEGQDLYCGPTPCGGVTYSDIEMGLPGEGNISEDPRFVDPANGDYHLRPDSPCIDAGINEFASETDWEMDPRPLDGDLDGAPVVDMGADEFQMVLAAYQAWHGLPSHAPAPYTSTDPIVISNHITAAQAQGIDGFVVDWYGPPDGLLNDTDREFIDRATAELLQQSEERGFYAAILYDEGTVSAAGVPTTAYQTRVISDLLYARRYLTLPAYLLVNRRPAVFVFPYDDVDPHIDWTEVRDQLGITVTLFDKDPNPGDPGHDTQFDGFYAWVQPTAGEWLSDCTEWGEGYLTWFYNTMASPTYAEKGTVGGVWPGFDDSLAPWGSGRCMSRRCGQTWRDTWRFVKQYNPPIVLIQTWNDFEEGTDVEFGIGHCVYLPLVMRDAPAAVGTGEKLRVVNPCTADLR